MKATKNSSRWPAWQTVFWVWSAWTAYALLEATLTRLQEGLSWPYLIRKQLFTYYLFALLILPIWYFSARHMFRFSWPKRLFLLMLGAVFFVALWYVAYVLLYPYAMYPRTLHIPSLQHYILYLLEDALRVYIAVVAIAYVWHYHRRLAEKESREKELRVHAKEMELAQLKAQLNPHFLFNTLHSVNALLGREPDRAREILAWLGDSLRYSLESDHESLLPLGRELTFVETYLRIERARFGSRLHFETHLDEGAERALIPPMMLQPLVENAIKHAIAPRERGGRIDLTATVHDGRLSVSLKDDGPGPGSLRPEQLLAMGRGLHHTHLRLKKIFDRHSDGLVFGEGQSGFQVGFHIPLRQADNPPTRTPREVPHDKPA